MRKRVVLNSPRLEVLRRKKHKSVRKKTTFLLIIIFLIIFGLSLSSRIGQLNINKITITGNKIIENKDIENVVKNEISGHYFWLFPKTNFLIYPKNKILSELNSKYKRLNNISININNFKTLEINVSEYEGKYLYCGLLIPPLRSNLNNNKCYFTDSDGYIFDEAPYFSGSVFFRLYGDASVNDKNPIGSYFMKNSFVKITEFKNTLEKINLKPTAFWVDDNRQEGNFSLSEETVIGPRIIFKIDSDYQKLAENLQAAISTKPLNTDIKTKLSTLLYLDLRFGNKVYYKFK